MGPLQPFNPLFTQVNRGFLVYGVYEIAIRKTTSYAHLIAVRQGHPVVFFICFANFIGFLPSIKRT